MKFLKQLFYGVFALGLIVSCSDEKERLNQEPKKASFNSYIYEDLLTRATGTTWEDGDQIGIYGIKPNTMLSEANLINNYKNIPYVTDANGVFNAVSTNIMYPNDDSEMGFVAYYPYKPNLEYAYPVDIAKQEDLLYSDNLKAVTGETSNTLRFTRALSKVVLNVTTANKMAVSGLAVTLKNVKTKATFSLADGTMQAEDTKTDVPLTIKAGATKIEALVLPNSENVMVEFVVAGKAYSWQVPHTLEQGKVYTYNITLDGAKDAPKVEIPKDFMEIPVYTAGGVAPNSQMVRHMVGSASWLSQRPNHNRPIRNYTVLFDKKNRLPYWVAYPMHKAYMRSGNRTNEWAFDPKLPEDVQPDLRSGFPDRSLNRGHVLESSARNASRELNVSTFYFSNMMAQNSRMNQGNWNRMEQAIQSWTKRSNDTIFLVTGSILSKPIKYTTDRAGKKIAEPSHMYKALLKKDRNGQYKSIAFKMENSSRAKPYSQCVVSVKEIEQETGFTFFPAVPKEVKEQKNLSDWR